MSPEPRTDQIEVLTEHFMTAGFPPIPARKLAEDTVEEAEARGAAEQRRKDAEGQKPVAWTWQYDHGDEGWRTEFSTKEPRRCFDFIRDIKPLYDRPANVAALEARIAELEAENGDKGLAAVHLLGILHRPDLTKTPKIEAAKRQLDAQFITGELRAALTREGGV